MVLAWGFILNNPALGYKWVVRYINKDGARGRSIADHHSCLSAIIAHLLANSARKITITDETIYKDD